MERQQEAFARNAKRGQWSPFKPQNPPAYGDGWFGQIDRAWANGWYAVLGRPVPTEWGEVLHLCVRDVPNGRLTWAELQWIKDQIAGPERLAVKVYPPQSRLVDEANMYHLWVLPKGMRLPFGIHADEQPKGGEGNG